jgi:hypothetical protein
MSRSGDAGQPPMKTPADPPPGRIPVPPPGDVTRGAERQPAPRGEGRHGILPPFRGSPSDGREHRTCLTDQKYGSCTLRIGNHEWWSVVATQQARKGDVRSHSPLVGDCKPARRWGQCQSARRAAGARGNTTGTRPKASLIGRTSCVRAICGPLRSDQLPPP